MISDELFDEMYDFYDEGQSENFAAFASAEDIFLSFMKHPHFQGYTGINTVRGNQLRAVFAISELARKEAESQRRQRTGIEEDGNKSHASERVHRLSQALRSARRRVRSLTKSLREASDQTGIRTDARKERTLSRRGRGTRATPGRTSAPAPLPRREKTARAGRG